MGHILYSYREPTYFCPVRKKWIPFELLWGVRVSLNYACNLMQMKGFNIRRWFSELEAIVLAKYMSSSIYSTICGQPINFCRLQKAQHFFLKKANINIFKTTVIRAIRMSTNSGTHLNTDVTSFLGSSREGHWAGCRPQDFNSYHTELLCCLFLICFCNLSLGIRLFLLCPLRMTSSSLQRHIYIWD